MTITPDQAMSFAEEATLKVETLTHIEKDQVFYSLVSDDGHTVATDLDKGDAELLAIAPDLAQTIAGMTEQWRCEANFNGTWAGITTWESSPDYARATMQRRHRYPTRLVRRLVGPAEPIDKETPNDHL